MPRYALEIQEPNGSTTKGEHTSEEDDWYDVGHFFRHEGRLLRVADYRDLGQGPYDQMLICTPSPE